jgi:hypothetical protein
MNKFALVLLLGGLAAAQTAPPEHGTRSITYEFKNVDIDRASEIVDFVTQLDNRVLIQLNRPFKTAIIQPNIWPNANTPPEVMEKTLELLKRYDVAPTPPPRVEFVGYLVWASFNYGSPPGQPIPAAIEEAVAEMKKTFAYTDYKLLDTVSTVVRHHAEVENVLAGTNTPGGAYFYTFNYGDTAVSTDGKTVNVNPFRFSLRIPSGGTYQNVGIATDVAIREGQKLVLGKVRTSVNDNVNIFLVLTVKLH